MCVLALSSTQPKHLWFQFVSSVPLHQERKGRVVKKKREREMQIQIYRERQIERGAPLHDFRSAFINVTLGYTGSVWLIQKALRPKPSKHLTDLQSLICPVLPT